MINRNIKIIILVMMMATFIPPLTVKAQFQTSYDQTRKFPNEKLAQILAPIALYPDVLLSQILIAASYPFEVVEADRWLARNPHLADEQLDDALQAKNWDISVLSLCHYPKVLNMMVDNLNWTAKLGDAFVYQQKDVMDTIQDLRARASAQGNLTTTEKQRVIVEEKIIRIEPAYHNYLYVPVYDPLVVYGLWGYPAFPPFRIFYPGVTVVGPRIDFSTRIFIGFGFIRWSLFDWPSCNIVIMNADRTRRFNRNYHVYHNPQHTVYWKPDHKKRLVRQMPVRQNPNYHPPVKQQPKKIIMLPRTKNRQIKPKTHILQPAQQSKQKQPVVRPRPQPVKAQTKPGFKPKAEPLKPQPRFIDMDRWTQKDRRPPRTVAPRKRTPNVISKKVTGTVKGADLRNAGKQAYPAAGESREYRRENERGSFVVRNGRR